MKKPLAYRMRPKTLADVFGQEHLTSDEAILNQMIKANLPQSMILYGPPGTGKTSLASAFAGSFHLPFRQLNAAIHSKSDLQQIAKEAKLYDQLVVLLDEIHRLDKSKQDFLLPMLEKGEIILIGATTENPYLTINPAIRSRVHILELKPLSKSSIIKILKKALMDSTNGLGKQKIVINEDTLDWFADMTQGDIRYALNTLELAIKSTKEEPIKITKDYLQVFLTKRNLKSDQNSDNHYNLLSAFQKSIRGSDVDAALHYLARLINNNDLDSIFRRLLVIAYEDIGLANPQLPVRVVSAIEACKQIGLPEARIPLATIVIDLCLSPKSNSALTAIDLALKDINQKYLPDIPSKLKDNHFSGASNLGNGENYLYPHNYPNGYVKQNYLPDEFLNRQYYTPKTTGKYERVLAAYYQQLKNL